MAYILFNYLLHLCDLHAPKKVFSIRRTRPPWFNDDVSELCANRDFMFQVGRRTAQPMLIAEATNLKNFIKHSLPKLKADYYTKVIEQDKEDPVKFSRHLNELLSKHTKTTIGSIKDPLTNQMLSPKDSANELNNYYVIAASHLTALLPTCRAEFWPTPLESHFQLHDLISCRRITETLKEFSPLKALGCLHISSKLYLKLKLKLKFYHNLTFSIYNNSITCCIFLDYSKAFDSVNHSILLHKLHLNGCQSMEWFQSYLVSRSPCVKVASSISGVITIPCGVPQGSVLGPTLFNIYINDVMTLPLSSKMLLYADDIVIYSSSLSFDEIFAKLQADLTLIYQWSVSNKLTLRVPKTKSLLIGRNKTLKKIDINKRFIVGTSKIEWVHDFTYLGAIIDENLTFNPALDRMHRKATYKLKLFMTIRRNLMTHSALTMAQLLIFPYLDYGNFLLSSCPLVQIIKLQVLQNRALKTALSVSRYYNTKKTTSSLQNLNGKR